MENIAIESVIGFTNDASTTDTYLQSLFKGTTVYAYDTRIDDYNWYLFFSVQFVFYFVLQALVRHFAPSPGDIKTFKEKRRLNDYHFYYFQYTSMVHALVGCICGKL